MSTVRERIVTAAVTALNTGRPSGVSAFVRTRVDSPGADQLPALTVYQAEETVEAIHSPKDGRSRGPVVQRFLTLRVEVVTKAGAGTEPDKAADPALAWATKVLAVAGSLGDLAVRAPDELGTRFEYEQGESSFCRATQMFRYQYQSRADDAERVS